MKLLLKLNNYETILINPQSRICCYRYLCIHCNICSLYTLNTELIRLIVDNINVTTKQI